MPRLGHLALRMDFLAAGEKLGWPRIGTLRAGQGAWEQRAKMPIRNVVPILRAAHVRIDNLQGEKDTELSRTVLMGDRLRFAVPEPTPAPTPPPAPNSYEAYLERRKEQRRENLARARAIRSARAAERKAAGNPPA